MKRFHCKRSGLVLCVLASVLWLWPMKAVWAEPVHAVAFNRFSLNYSHDAQVHYYVTGTPDMTGWIFEGVEGYVSPATRMYTVPLYRFSSDSGTHFYTTSEVERANLPFPYVVMRENGDVVPADEGIAGYVIPADNDIPGTVPLYRFVREHTINSNTRFYLEHLYSLNSILPVNYISDGIACRVWKDSVQLPDMLLKFTVLGSGDKWDKGSVQKIGWAVWTGGGFLRLSYSSDNRQSWATVADVPITKKYGVVSGGSYDWKLPANLLGKIIFKLEWVKFPGDTAIPWASVQSGNIDVGGRN